MFAVRETGTSGGRRRPQNCESFFRNENEEQILHICKWVDEENLVNLAINFSSNIANKFS